VGLRRIGPDLPLSPDTPMRVASISKIATAFAALTLVDRGLIGLETDLARFLGPWMRNPAFPDAKITLRQLLAHTSSMRDGEVYWGTWGERIEDFFTPAGKHWEGGAHWEKAHPPGRYFTYCNLAFGVIATVIERITSQRFDLFAHEAVLAPLQMEAGFNWSELAPARIAEGATLYRRIDGAWAAQTDNPLPVARAPVANGLESPAQLVGYMPGTQGALFSPQGGLRASVVDVAKMGLAILKDGAPILSRSLGKAMGETLWRHDGKNGDTLERFYLAQGLGLHVLPAGNEGPIANQLRPMIGHAAEAFGLLGGLYVDRAAQAGFAYLFTGGPADDARKPGARSGFKASEEAALGALYEAVVRNAKA
jgi:CubicO group peptidase (beta-lactamase class C family)